MTPLTSTIDALLSESPVVKWLREAGPIAKLLNEQSKHDSQGSGSAAEEATPGYSR